MRITDDFLYENMPKAEKEMLNGLPNENEIQHTFSFGFRQKMKKIIKQQSRTKEMTMFINYARNLVAISFIVIGITFCGVMSAKAYRTSFFSFIKNVYKELTSIVFNIDETNNSKYSYVYPSYVPDGYEILEQWQNEHENVIIYSNKNKDELVYKQQAISNSEHIFDSENAKTDVININDIEVNILQKNDITQAYWTYENNIFFISGRIDKNEIIRIVKNTIKN